MNQSSLSKLKKFILVFTIVLLIFVSLFIMFDNGVFSKFSRVKFDKTALQFANTKVSVYDKNNQELDNQYLSSRKYISLNQVPDYVVQAFVSVEDKNFYTHKGINYKRIMGAVVNNIKSLSFKEGASTISQQLIKNTHLSSKKTLSRKLDEILLTQQLEKNFSKDQIMQAYLNVIYFGSGTFGIEQASQRYFNKSAANLTLDEGAILAGIIKSPEAYSPTNNPEKCLKRRNLVLKEMFDDGKISKEQYNASINKKIELNLNEKALGNNTYLSASIDQACKILNLSEKDLVIDGYKIYTYMDPNLQNEVTKAVSKINIDNNPDKLSMVIDSDSGGILAYYGKSNYNLQQLRRQPGSTIKPILVYTPALENNLINPITPILDEPYSLGDYTPKNYQNKYVGWTDIETAVAKSLNIPAVKTLEYVGIEKAKNYTKKLGLNYEKEDCGYALALGGFNKGITIQQLANSYIPLSNGGYFVSGSFIRKIENKYGRVVYKNNQTKTKVIRDDTAYLMTKMLRKTVIEGSGRKLADMPYDIACKTGTVGGKNQTNLDAYNIAYTPNYVVATWLGNTSGKVENNLTQSTNGANQPTLINKNILQKIADTDKFVVPDSIEKLDIDMLEYKENHLIKLASINTPTRYKKQVEFSKFNVPKQTSDNFIQIKPFEIKHNIYPDKTEIIVPSKSYLDYELYKKVGDKTTKIFDYNNKDGDMKFYDKDIVYNQLTEYYAVAKLDIDKGSISKQSNTIKIYKTDNKKTISNNEIVWE